MGLLLLLTGIFGGLFVFMATVYSLSQAVLARGRVRAAHLCAIAATLAVMAALSGQYLALARVLAVPLIAAAAVTFAVERGWYRVFPVLHQIFGLIVLAGLVAL